MNKNGITEFSGRKTGYPIGIPGCLLWDNIVFFHVDENLALSFETEAVGGFGSVEGHAESLFTVVDEYFRAVTVKDNTQLDFSSTVTDEALAVVNMVTVRAGVPAADTESVCLGIEG